jgi:molybdopterin-guanine dinucleotide biosynthesis protein A
MDTRSDLDIVVILAGGQSRRMGRDKLGLPYRDATLLEYSARLYSEHFDRVYLSVGDAGKYADLGIECIEDIFRGCGPMAGLHAALLKIGADGIFLMAADLPFAAPETARFIMRRGRGHDACIIRKENGDYEPLFGYYAKTMLPRAQKALEMGLYPMTALYRDSDVCFIGVAEFGDLWHENLLLNINSPKDYEKAVSL